MILKAAQTTLLPPSEVYLDYFRIKRNIEITLSFIIKYCIKNYPHFLPLKVA